MHAREERRRRHRDKESVPPIDAIRPGQSVDSACNFDSYATNGRILRVAGGRFVLARTFSIMRANYSVYLVIITLAFLPFVLETYFGKSGSASNTGLAYGWSLLAFHVQKSVLYGADFSTLYRRSNTKPLAGTFVYFMKNTLIMLVALALGFLVFVGLGKSLGFGELNGWWYLGMFTLFIVAYAFALALIGTWLPAGIHGQGKSLADAFKRGLGKLGPTFGRSLAGVSLPLILTAVALIAIPTASDDLIVHGSLNVPLVALIAFAAAVQAVSITYLSVVLTIAYMEAEGLGADLSRELNDGVGAI